MLENTVENSDKEGVNIKCVKDEKTCQGGREEKIETSVEEAKSKNENRVEIK